MEIYQKVPDKITTPAKTENDKLTPNFKNERLSDRLTPNQLAASSISIKSDNRSNTELTRQSIEQILKWLLLRVEFIIVLIIMENYQKAADKITAPTKIENDKLTPNIKNERSSDQ
jgi:hypothetical protein